MSEQPTSDQQLRRAIEERLTKFDVQVNQASTAEEKLKLASEEDQALAEILAEFGFAGSSGLPTSPPSGTQ